MSPSTANFYVYRQTSLLKGVVYHIVKSVVPGCYITSSFACGTVSWDIGDKPFDFHPS